MYDTHELGRPKVQASSRSIDIGDNTWQHGVMSKQEHAVLRGARIVVVNRTGRMKGYDA